VYSIAKKEVPLGGFRGQIKKVNGETKEVPHGPIAMTQGNTVVLPGRPSGISEARNCQVFDW